jgi:hypothetical protein
MIDFLFCGCAGKIGIGSAYIAVKVSAAKDYPFIVTASLTEKVSVKKDSFDSTYNFCYWSLK